MIRMVDWMRKQDAYWKENLPYIQRNSNFDFELGVKAWNTILDGIDRLKIQNVLDCGSNIGRNIGYLMDERLLNNRDFTALDINIDALNILKSKHPNVQTLEANLIDFDSSETYDLVFTSGVLIHIHPDNLKNVFDRLMLCTKKYLILIEYFSRTITEIVYHGQSELLWKRDYGKDFMEHSNWRVVSYGFLWGQEFDDCGFDDCNYWVFERN